MNYHVSFDILSVELKYSLRACLVAGHYDHDQDDNSTDNNTNKDNVLLSLVDKLQAMNIIQPIHKSNNNSSNTNNNSSIRKNRGRSNSRSGGDNDDKDDKDDDEDEEDTMMMMMTTTTRTTSDRISMSSFVIMLCICAMYAFPMEPEIKRLNKLFEMLNIK